MARDIRQGICPGCDHDEIIESIPLEASQMGLNPIAVTHQRVRFLGSRGFDPNQGYGKLRAFVCRRCGLTQWFADKPDEIPVGPEHLTRIIKGDRGGPYR